MDHDLDEGFEALDLPEGAEQNEDGSITLTFQHPCVLRRRAGEETTSETIETLLINRVDGRALRRLFEKGGKVAESVVFAAATGLTQARLAQILDKADARDVSAFREVIKEILDFGEGLPERAERQDDGSILLKLRHPVGDHVDLTFRPMTGAALTAMGAAREPVIAGFAKCCGLSPKDAGELIDEMDGADAMGVQRVVSFFSGSGRKTGR